jgi:hypothetical protein
LFHQRLGILFAFSLIIGLFLVAEQIAASSRYAPPRQAQATPAASDVATAEELAQARAEWSRSEHASTYDEGMGANTTCARCKSPRNWDPTQELAAEEALNCSSCKRVPGAPRPELSSGVPVPKSEWQQISCDICHIPIGDSFSKEIVFWNQATGQYEEVPDVMSLCARCHEGRHGFEVIEEQETSPAHNGWECTRCHGAHGDPVACVDCHDIAEGETVETHKSHETVNCTACHDAGQLSIWYDDDPSSNHYGETVPVRFAHALTSWPSHNLQLQVTCERCHHPRNQWQGAIADQVACQICHEEGAVLFWCIPAFMRRDPNPYPDLLPTPQSKP